LPSETIFHAGRFGQFHAQHWGDTHQPLLIFIHGGRANLSWWHHIAPHFSQQYHCVAISLYGHGYSDHLDHYSIDALFEPLRYLKAHHPNQPVSIVAHSMGGIIAYHYHQQYRLDRLLLIDAPIHWPYNQPTQTTPAPPLRASQDMAIMLARFHTIPPQPLQKNSVVETIVTQSVRLTADGYIWTFDPDFAHKCLGISAIKAQYCENVTLIYGGQSTIINTDALIQIRQLYPHIDLHCIDRAHHAIMLDYPNELIAIIQEKLNTTII